MSDIKEQVLAFFEKCDELKKCKFIMATTKIKEILRCIVNSPDIYALLDEVTKDFNYPLVKSSCLVTASDGVYSRSYIVMPNTVGHRLAFGFCLLVEFDRGSLNFNDFLRQYFPEDGSYYSSYHAFCDTVIDGMRDALSQVFKEELEKPLEVNASNSSSNAAKAGLISSINLAVSEEMQYITVTDKIPEQDKEGGLIMLSELICAVRSGNKNLINALVCGYNYFVSYYNCTSDGFAAMLQEIASLEQFL